MNLPVGYYKFSKKAFFNYQLNRWYSLGYTKKQEIEEAGRRIKNFEDNKHVFTELARRAEAEGRLKNAAFYYRAAEFLTSPFDPVKKDLYDRFSDTFYKAFADDGIERHTIPYPPADAAPASGEPPAAAPHSPTGAASAPIARTEQDAAGDTPEPSPAGTTAEPSTGEAAISAMKLSPVGVSKGTVVIHGGFDSFIEEFYCFWKAFAEAGYTVIAFDGPGQGSTLVHHHVASDHDWEKPVGAVLDYFGAHDVTLLGISFGGYWCVRAAAFEKRVKRLIIDPPFYDLMEKESKFLQGIVSWLMRHRKFLNWSIRTRMKLIPVIEHAVNQVLHVNRRLDASPDLAADWLLAMNKHHIHSQLVDQDVLILVGEKDKFQSPKLYELQKAALVSARSVEGRVFTTDEHAQNHCQMGNLGLALDYMVDWLERVTSSYGGPDIH